MNSKYYPVIKLCHEASVMKRRVTLPIRLLKSGLWRSDSYFPELPNHKSRLCIFCELLWHIMKYGSIEYHYFSYGFDIKGLRNQDDYLGDNWLWESSMINTVLSRWEYTCILRDKALFSEMLTLWGFKTPHVVYDVNKGCNIDEIVNSIFANRGGYFCKPFDGQCGEGIIKLIVCERECYIDGEEMQIEEAMHFVKGRFANEHYIVQTLVEQHSILNSIYDKSVNTLRLMTLYDKKRNIVIPFSAVLRIGANGNTVDNWAKGGLAVGVDIESGKLKQYGFYKHGCGLKTLEHPNTHFRFEGVRLPDFEEAIESAKRLHYRLKEIPIIGWDIAFTPEGPLFIEGNDNPEISINQEVNGGLKKEFEKIFGKN